MDKPLILIDPLPRTVDSIRDPRRRLARKFHHEGKKVAKSFRQPVTIESLTQEVTGDFANDGL
jgi:hypothetical protein